MEKDRRLYSRRQALCLGHKTLLLIGVSSLYPMGRFLTGNKEQLAVARIAGSDITLSNHWQRFKQTRFWLRQGSNGVEAIWASCTHLGCEVSFDLGQEQWLCPCHGSRFNREGQPIQGPAQYPLLRVSVKEKDGYFILNQPAESSG